MESGVCVMGVGGEEGMLSLDKEFTCEVEQKVGEVGLAQKI